jgi:hypothetical protein
MIIKTEANEQGFRADEPASSPWIENSPFDDESVAGMLQTGASAQN